jgi:hypothetical protein
MKETLGSEGASLPLSFYEKVKCLEPKDGEIVYCYS